jgi:hypothetical protein
MEAIMAETQQKPETEKAEKASTYVALVNVLDAKGKIVPPGSRLKLTKAEAEALPPNSVEMAKADKSDT